MSSSRGRGVRTALFASTAAIVVIVGLFSYAPPGTKSLLGMHWLAWMATAVPGLIAMRMLRRVSSPLGELLISASLGVVLFDQILLLSILWIARPSQVELSSMAIMRVVDVAAAVVMFAPIAAVGAVIAVRAGHSRNDS